MNYLQHIWGNNHIRIEKKEGEEKMKQKITKKGCRKENEGITLVALVVTIVVLLILAGITITILFGDNGIIKSAQKAKDLTEQDQINTQEGIANLVDQLDKLTGNYDEETGWNLDKVKKAVVDGQNIPVPVGYSLSKATGENSVNTGLVLYEGEEEVNDDNVEASRTSRNQFVWVPVPDITKMAKLQEGSSENYMGVLYNFEDKDGVPTATEQTTWKPGTENNREPDVITNASSGADNASGTDYDAKSDYLTQAGLPADSTANDFKKQLQNEFNSMVESVKQYKGFYIGRYETSGLSYSDMTVKPTVQKGKIEGLQDGAWYIAYNESKNVKANENVTSSMIWGCQWDATLRWFLTSSDNAVKTFVTNGDGKGNYETSSLVETGLETEYGVNNIYDMAGNVAEWTIEAYNAYNRVPRRRLLLRFWLWISSFFPPQRRRLSVWCEQCYSNR